MTEAIQKLVISHLKPLIEKRDNLKRKINDSKKTIQTWEGTIVPLEQEINDLLTEAGITEADVK